MLAHQRNNYIHNNAKYGIRIVHESTTPLNILEYRYTHSYMTEGADHHFVDKIKGCKSHHSCHVAL